MNTYAATVITVTRRSGRRWQPETFRAPATVMSLVEVLRGEHDGLVKVEVTLHPGESSRVVTALAEDVRIAATPTAARIAATDWDAAKRGE